MAFIVADWATEIIAITAAIGLLFGAFAWYINITITARFVEFREKLNSKYLGSEEGKLRLNEISNRLDAFNSHWDRILKLFEDRKL